MKIIRCAMAGTLESSDALVTVEPLQGKIEIEIASVVIKQFGLQIERAVRDVLAEQGVGQARIMLNDRGAVECVIKARVEAAVKRAAEVNEA